MRKRGRVVMLHFRRLLFFSLEEDRDEDAGE